jgi:hypothetical protein
VIAEATIRDAGGTGVGVLVDGIGGPTPRIVPADPRRGALEYNVGRSGCTATPERPISANALRVLSVLMGSWVANGSPGCEPLVGTHAIGCLHRANRQLHRRRDVCRAVYGHDGGRQVTQLGRALDELADESTGFYVYDPARRVYSIRRSHVLRYQESGKLASPRAGDRSPDAALDIRWDPFVLDSLADGHFQAFPAELVRGLHGSALLLLVAVLLQPPTAALRGVGDACDYAVTGTDPTISPARLGLSGQRPDKLRASLECACGRVNGVAHNRLGLVCTVLARAHGAGLKVRVRRVNARRRGAAHQDARCGTAGPIVRHRRTDRAALQDATRAHRAAHRHLETSQDGGLASKPACDNGPAPTPPESATTEEERDRRIDFARAVLSGSTVGPAADRARATLAGFGITSEESTS